MRKTARSEQLREVRSKALAAALLTRMVAPHLVQHLVERMEIGERVRRRRPSPRRRRVTRALRIGAYAVGAAAAGVAAARVAGRHVRLDDHAPESHRA